MKRARFYCSNWYADDYYFGGSSVAPTTNMIVTSPLITVTTQPAMNMTKSGITWPSTEKHQRSKGEDGRNPQSNEYSLFLISSEPEING